jgi:hypothetical protein
MGLINESSSLMYMVCLFESNVHGLSLMYIRLSLMYIAGLFESNSGDHQEDFKTNL